MSAHSVDIGAKVKSSDGKDVGNVHQLILRGDSNRVGGFVLSKHVFGVEKIVPARAVESSSQHEVKLKLTAAEVEQLDAVVHTQMVRAPEGLTYGIGMGGLVDISGTGENWVVRGGSGGEYAHTGAEPFFFEAPIGNVEVENLSSLPEDALLINEGTEVIGSDFKKIGHIDQVILEDGRVTGVIVKAGFIFKHDVHIPVSLVAGASHEHVRLTVTADEAEKLSDSH